MTSALKPLQPATPLEPARAAPSTQDAFQELFQEVDDLEHQVAQSDIPDELKENTQKMMVRLKRMARFGGYSEEYEKISHYVDWILHLPWNAKKEESLDIHQAKEILDKHHYGMEGVKNRILEYMSILKLNKDKRQHARAPIMLLVGLVGTGKTTFGPALSEATGRDYARIPFGGMGSSKELRGQSRLHLDSQPGQVIKALRRAGSRNPIILLDEIDRISKDALNDVMGVLVELLDPGQNHRFIDAYLDYPFDLSDVIFIATSNNTRDIATAVLDRMEVIQMPSYTDHEKITIGKLYLLPKVLKESGMDSGQVTISDDVWGDITRPLGFDSGIRTLERTIRSIVYRVARLIVEGKGQAYHIDKSNIRAFLPQS
jgi:ATP-dependent Lon protease